MATRGKAPFQKRQKELARQDKQKRKAERRAQRKLDNADSPNDPVVWTGPDSEPDVETDILNPLSDNE
jgi:hypothetical protein